MTAQAVHWHEGMFLRPQHFQASERRLLHLADQGTKWDLHYNWSFRTTSRSLARASQPGAEAHSHT